MGLWISTEQSERLHIRDYLQMQGIQMCVCVCVTKLLHVCLGGSETYRANVAISAVAGRRLAARAWFSVWVGSSYFSP